MAHSQQGVRQVLCLREISDGPLKILWLTEPCHTLLMKHLIILGSMTNVHDTRASFSVSQQASCPFWSLPPLVFKNSLLLRPAHMRYKKNQPSMTSPFAKCWGQTATKRSLEKYSGVASTSGWFLMVPFWTDFQACNMADHLFGPLLFQHQGSTFRENGFMGGTTVFSC